MATASDLPARAGMASGSDLPGQAGMATASDPTACPTSAPCNACEGCGTCGSDPAFWFRSDYLMWWGKGSRIPSLVVTGTPNDPFGTLLFGDTTIDQEGHSGYDIRFGAWLNDCHTLGLEFEYLDIPRDQDSFDTGFSPGFPTLGRPFLDVTNPAAPFFNTEITALPGIAAGMVHVDWFSYFQSAGLDLRYKLCDSCCQDACCRTRGTQVDLIGGYRYYRLLDGLSVHEDLVGLSGLGAGVGFDLLDNFRASNNFNGGELGMVVTLQRGPWSLGLTGKTAIGSNHEIVNISGRTIRTTGTTQDVDLGGLLALPTNIGEYSRDRIAVIPQFGAEVGYQFNCHLRAYVGYDILYWDRVVRAGEQVDLRIDTNNLPFGTPGVGGGPFPAFTWHEASYWAQGIRLGAELKF
jgi:hypothetical protein